MTTLTCCAAAFSACDEHATVEARVDQITQTFASSCRLGPWTSAALSRSQSLTSSYQALLESAGACNKEQVRRSLHAAQSLESELRTMMASEALKNERIYDDRSNELLLEVNDPNVDPETKSALISFYASSRYELSLSRAEARYVRGSNGEADALVGMARISAQASALIDESAALSSCLAENPVHAWTLATNLLEIAGSFAPSLVGAGLSTLASLSKISIEAAQKVPLIKLVRQSQRDRIPLMIDCGLEALTRDYCSARDAHRLAAYERYAKGEVSEFFQGVNLLDRRLPILNQWLDRIVNGVVPQDIDQARKINAQFARVDTGTQIKRLLVGHFNEAIRNVQRVNDEEGKVAFVKKAVLELFDGILFVGTSSVANSPFAGFDGAESVAETILGREIPEGDASDIYQRLEKVTYRSDELNDIRDRLFELYDQRYSLVVQEFNDKVNVDSPSLVRDGTRRGLDKNSPYTVMQEAIEFFENYRFEENEFGEQDKLLIKQTKKRMEGILKLLDDPKATSDEKQLDDDENLILSKADQIISEVFAAFKLENNNVFLPIRLQGLVRTDLVNRYHKGELPTDLDDILVIAGRDIESTLSEAGVTSPHILERDIDQAQSLTTASLEGFRKFMSPLVQDALVALKNRADRGREPDFLELSRVENSEEPNVRAPNRRMLAQLCLKTLVSGMHWPKGVDVSLCSDSFMQLREQPKVRLEFSELKTQLKDKRFDDRVCIYEDFVRKDRLSQIHPPEMTSMPQMGLMPPTLWEELTSLVWEI